MSDADATPPTEPGPAAAAPALDPTPSAVPTPGLARPALTPLVTLGSENADACSDGLCS